MWLRIQVWKRADQIKWKFNSRTCKVSHEELCSLTCGVIEYPRPAGEQHRPVRWLLGVSRQCVQRWPNCWVLSESMREGPPVFYVVTGQLKNCVQCWGCTLKGSIQWSRMVRAFEALWWGVHHGSGAVYIGDKTGQDRAGSLALWKYLLNSHVKEELDLICMNLQCRCKEAETILQRSHNQGCLQVTWVPSSEFPVNEDSLILTVWHSHTSVIWTRWV